MAGEQVAIIAKDAYKLLFQPHLGDRAAILGVEANLDQINVSKTQVMVAGELDAVGSLLDRLLGRYSGTTATFTYLIPSEDFRRLLTMDQLGERLSPSGPCRLKAALAGCSYLEVLRWECNRLTQQLGGRCSNCRDSSSLNEAAPVLPGPGHPPRGSAATYSHAA